jgi:citrate synthase
MGFTPSLTAAQAAARLGVKHETLYAYVSRGLLSRTRTAAGSRFDPLEVERFAERRARRAAPRPRPASRASGAPLMVLDTDIALIEDDELYFRGRSAVGLATAFPYDAVAAWIWGEPLDPTRRLTCPAALVAPARRLAGALPPSATLLDRAATAVHGLAAADPLRDDASPARLPAIGENLAAGIPHAIAADATEGESVSQVLWRALSDRPAAPGHLAALDAALILSIDHDLAISTFAARVAASARASGYAIISAALGAFDSALHGNASRAAVDLIRAVAGGTPADEAIRDQLRSRTSGVPGLGHRLYTGMDPRARALLALIAELPDARPVIAAIDALCDSVSDAGLRPNLDLALAALVVACDLPSDAGVLIFAVGRITGWIANAMAEYGAEPLRLRPAGRYVGPLPADQSV